MEDDPEFEWDDAKAARNLARHGVGFEAIRLRRANRHDQRLQQDADVMKRKLEVRMPTPEEDSEITAAALADPDNPPWTAEDFARARRGRPRINAALRRHFGLAGERG